MIYLLYDHDEGGPENLIGDTCPVRFHERAVAWLNDRYETTNTLVAGKTWADVVSAAMDAGPDRHYLLQGWGGPSIHIIPDGDTVKERP